MQYSCKGKNLIAKEVLYHLKDGTSFF